ncbi:hypothetical protein DPMN_113401 [Dreissena polymorpha]|uniref:Uncharacterized protein n=1 Tax=Dreissena polymorpha TaxID=45954 RepID=A0A9D4KHW5_DREPO|nr:hypothetical protein DPMN_113401 [Dreissena polymorpha]
MPSPVCMSISFTAYHLVLGREVYTPTDLVIPLSSHEAQFVTEYYHIKKQIIVSVDETARKCLSGCHAHMKRDHHVRFCRNTCWKDDLLYVLNMSGKKGKAKKLLPQWIGPGVVEK